MTSTNFVTHWVDSTEAFTTSIGLSYKWKEHAAPMLPGQPLNPLIKSNPITPAVRSESLHRNVIMSMEPLL